MVSRQETARPLLTPGEIMQLPPDDELVLVSGCPPIRAKKVRYYEDRELPARILPPPALLGDQVGRRSTRQCTHNGRLGRAIASPTPSANTDDSANAGIRREPELPEHEEIVPATAKTGPRIRADRRRSR